MQFKSLIAATALAVTSFSSLALTQNVGNISNNGSFVVGDNVSGMATFSDTYNFTLSGANTISGTAFSANVTGFTVSLLNSSSTVIGTDTTPDTFSFSGLVAGTSYGLRFTGTTSGTPAFYGGNVTAAVPEPQVYSLMLAGLGAVGLVVARRRRAG